MASHSPSNQAEKELTANDLAELLNVLTPVASKSHALGLQLGIPDSKILNIEVNHRTIEGLLYGILAARLKQEAPLKWHVIVRALRADSIGEYELARKIESQYMPPSQMASLALQQETVAHSSTDIPSWSPQLHVNTCTSGAHTTSLALQQPAANYLMSVPHQLPHAVYHVDSEQERMYCPPQPKRLRQQLAETQPPSHTQQPAPLRNTATCSTTHISSPQLLTHTPAAHPTSPVSTQPSAINVVSEIPYADHQVVSQQQPMYDNPPSHHLYTSMPFNEQSYIIPQPQFPNYYLHPPTFPSSHFVLYCPSAPYTTSSPQTQEQSVVRPENIQHDPSQYLPPYIGPVSTPHSDSWDSPAAEWHTQRLACQSPSHTQQPAVTVPLNNTHQATETASSNNTQQTTVRASPSQKTVADTHLPRLFIDYVTTIYKGSPVETSPKALKWPLTPSKVYINLVCIDRKARGLRREYDEVTEAMVLDGNVDVIYGKKWPIDMNEIVAGISGIDCKKLVLIEGAPGVGKSTFAWEFCRRWVRGELAQQYELVILLRLREERISKATMLKDLIYHPSEEVQQNVVTHLASTHGTNVLIILEGYDELSDEYRNMHSVFMQLIYGQLLPLATVMVTSRPWATRELLVECSNRLVKHIEILGFNKEQISFYIKSVLSENDVTGLNDYIKRHPQIEMCMYIPLNCAIVVKVYQESQDYGHALPTTLTELYKALTRILLIRYLRHYQDKEGTKCIKIFEDLPVPRHVHNNFIELCKLAYSGIVESADRVQLIFRNLPSDFDNLGFMDSVTDLYVTQGTVSSHNFLHLTFQEFFAAVHISLMSPSEQLGMYKVHTGRLNVVLRFLAGLNKLDCFSRENLAHIFESSETKGNPVPCDLIVDNFHIQWMFEAQNDEVTNYVLGKNKKIQFNSKRMLAMDYFSLGYCLACSQSEWVLSIGGEIDVKEVKLLLATKTSFGCRIIGLGGARNPAKLSMENLRISLDALDLFFSGLENVLQLYLLCLRLPQPCDRITWPDLSALQDLRLEVCHETNWRLDSLLPHLSLRSLTVVGGIADHELATPGISCEDCVAIANFIKSTDLNKLCIGESDMFIEDDGMESLTRALVSNPSLPLEGLGLMCSCKFTDTAAEYLAQFVTRCCTLKYISIGGSRFNVHGLLVLAQAVNHSSSLQEKVINKECIPLILEIDGKDEANDLATLLVEYWNLWNCGNQMITKISEVGVIALSQALNSSKMAVLQCLNSSIKDEGARVLGNALRCNFILKELHLPNNSIHDAGAIALAQALHHNSTLQTLDLSFNSISDEGTTALARALHHNSTLQTLDLSSNSISDEGAVALAQALHVNSTLRELNLTGNEGIGKEGCNYLVKALTINNMSIINGKVVDDDTLCITPYNGLMLPESCIEHISVFQEYHSKISFHKSLDYSHSAW